MYILLPTTNVGFSSAPTDVISVPYKSPSDSCENVEQEGVSVLSLTMRDLQPGSFNLHVRATSVQVTHTHQHGHIFPTVCQMSWDSRSTPCQICIHCSYFSSKPINQGNEHCPDGCALMNQMLSPRNYYISPGSPCHYITDYPFNTFP